MDEVLSKFVEVSTDPYTSLARWKEDTGKKIIGCFPMRIPEEIIHASGMLPVVMWRGNEAVTLGHSYVHNFNCGLTRSFIDDVMKGKLGFMDGMIFYRSCLQAEEIPSTIEMNVPPSHFLYLYLPPLYPGAPTRDFLMQQFMRLKEHVEGFWGSSCGSSSGSERTLSLEGIPGRCFLDRTFSILSRIRFVPLCISFTPGG